MLTNENAAAVLNLLKEGKENAITTEQITIKTGLNARDIRRSIELLRLDYCIINNQDGNGYYIAENKIEAFRFLKQEEARAKAIYRRLKGTRNFLKVIEGQEEL